MLAPFATLIFLAAFWLVAKLMIETIDESGGRMLAALRGQPHPNETRIPAMRVRVSRPRILRPVAAVRQQWRDAA
jgi:hypothetical protein